LSMTDANTKLHSVHVSINKRYVCNYVNTISKGATTNRRTRTEEVLRLRTDTYLKADSLI